MAWPNTPLTTYLAGGLPFIKAADLNSIQSGINGIINATYSLAAVVVDGTGGAVVVPVAGTAKVSATASSTGVGSAVAWGLGYKEQTAFGGITCDDTGAVAGGFNIKALPGLVGAAGHPITGTYIVTFHGAASASVGRYIPVACPSWVTAGPNNYDVKVSNVAIVGADLQVTVLVYDNANAALDAAWSLIVFGG